MALRTVIFLCLQAACALAAPRQVVQLPPQNILLPPQVIQQQQQQELLGNQYSIQEIQSISDSNQQLLQQQQQAQALQDVQSISIPQPVLTSGLQSVLQAQQQQEEALRNNQQQQLQGLIQYQQQQQQDLQNQQQNLQQQQENLEQQLILQNLQQQPQVVLSPEVPQLSPPQLQLLQNVQLQSAPQVLQSNPLQPPPSLQSAYNLQALQNLQQQQLINPFAYNFQGLQNYPPATQFQGPYNPSFLQPAVVPVNVDVGNAVTSNVNQLNGNPQIIAAERELLKDIEVFKPLNGNEGDNDAIIIEAQPSPSQQQRVFFVMPNPKAKFSIGQFIQSLPWFPFEVNVPDTIAWAWNGLGNIIGGIGQRLPFSQKLQQQPTTQQQQIQLRQLQQLQELQQLQQLQQLKRIQQLQLQQQLSLGRSPLNTMPLLAPSQLGQIWQ